jgi:hypothetical protein
MKTVSAMESFTANFAALGTCSLNIMPVRFYLLPHWIATPQFNHDHVLAADIAEAR